MSSFETRRLEHEWQNIYFDVTNKQFFERAENLRQGPKMKDTPPQIGKRLSTMDPIATHLTTQNDESAKVSTRRMGPGESDPIKGNYNTCQQ